MLLAAGPPLTSALFADLAMILVRFKLQQSFVFCTTTLGVQDSYSKVDFYKKEFESDALRVDDLFRNAHKQGVKIMHTSVPC